MALGPYGALGNMLGSDYVDSIRYLTQGGAFQQAYTTYVQQNGLGINSSAALLGHNIFYRAASPIAPEETRMVVSPTRAIDRLRKEIMDWHGNILEK